VPLFAFSVVIVGLHVGVCDDYYVTICVFIATAKAGGVGFHVEALG